MRGWGWLNLRWDLLPGRREEVSRPLLPPLSQHPVHFWFATGGAGFCISRGLALKMSPWAR